MGKNVFRKSLAVGIIILFIVVGVLPCISGNNIKLNASDTIFIKDISFQKNLVGYPSELEYSKNSESNPYVIIETSLGTIKIILFKDLVPNTVDNFINLTKIGFYDGLVFHRVIDGFVIQGGGYYPNGTYKESPFGPINLEIHPCARHVNGAIGMARTSDPNSATSQFYICDGSQHGLDDDYAVFGRVTIDSLSVVRKIAAVETMTKYRLEDWPVNDVIINSLTMKVKSKQIDTSLLNIFEDYTNLLPILQIFLSRIG